MKKGYLDVDDGNAAWAACELVAIASGHGKNTDDRISELATRINPTVALRKLALALPRIADQESSERNCGRATRTSSLRSKRYANA